jgi:hypothetical protein
MTALLYCNGTRALLNPRATLNLFVCGQEFVPQPGGCMSALLSLIFAFPIFALALRILAEWHDADALQHAPPPSPPSRAPEDADGAVVDAETQRRDASAASVFTRSLL